MLPQLLQILKKQQEQHGTVNGIFIVDDTDNPPKFEDEQIKKLFFEGRQHKPVIMMPAKQKYKLFDDYNNMTQKDIEKVLDIPNAELIDWLLYPDTSNTPFVLTDYHKQTITAMITKIECGVCEYKGSNILSLIESLINLLDMVKHCIPIEQLKGIISDDIIESSIIHVCFRKHFYDEIDAIIPTSADIKHGLSKMKNPYYIKKMNDYVDLYLINIPFEDLIQK